MTIVVILVVIISSIACFFFIQSNSVRGIDTRVREKHTRFREQVYQPTEQLKRNAKLKREAVKRSHESTLEPQVRKAEKRAKRTWRKLQKDGTNSALAAKYANQEKALTELRTRQRRYGKVMLRRQITLDERKGKKG